MQICGSLNAAANDGSEPMRELLTVVLFKLNINSISFCSGSFALPTTNCIIPETHSASAREQRAHALDKQGQLSCFYCCHWNHMWLMIWLKAIPLKTTRKPALLTWKTAIIIMKLPEPFCTTAKPESDKRGLLAHLSIIICWCLATLH